MQAQLPSSDSPTTVHVVRDGSARFTPHFGICSRPRPCMLLGATRHGFSVRPTRCRQDQLNGCVVATNDDSRGSRAADGAASAGRI